MANEPLIDELLIRGADDWITASEVAWIAKSKGEAGTEESITELSVGLIRAVLLSGLMEAGDVTDAGFFAWETASAESAARIERAWKELGHLPDIGDVCWLANTEAGDDRARAAASRAE
jgi:hypothetical protein